MHLSTMAEAIKSAFAYDPETGVVTRRCKCGATDQKRPVGNPDANGYLRLCFRGKTFRIHRVAWLLHFGDVPAGSDIDHISGVKTDNRLSNLRLVTRKQNCENRTATSGKSKYRGVGWCKRAKVWKAYVRHEGVLHHLGNFQDEEEAGAAAKAGRDRLFTHHTN